MIGETKDVGFQVGVRRTFHLTAESAWNFLLSEQGRKIWLGRLAVGGLGPDTHFLSNRGVEGTVTVLKECSHIRMSWRMSDDPVESKLQVRVISSGKNAVISFHQEKLRDNAHRAKMKKHWKNVLTELSAADL